MSKKSYVRLRESRKSNFYIKKTLKGVKKISIFRATDPPCLETGDAEDGVRDGVVREAVVGQVLVGVMQNVLFQTRIQPRILNILDLVAEYYKLLA